MALSNAAIGSLRCSSQSADLVLFSSMDIVFTREVAVFFSCILGCLHFPEGFCFLGFMWLLYSHSPTHFFVRKVHFFPIFSFDASLYKASQKAYQSASTRRGPHLSFSVWLTFTTAFDVSTSSALNVNSSEFSLTITSGHPSGTCGFVLEMFPCPGSSIQHQRPRSLSTSMNSRKPFVRPFLLSLPRFFTDSL